MKQLLAIGVILLFIGMNISSSTGFNLEKQPTIKPLNGKTLYVGGSGPNNYSKIQDAIDDASDGDMVFVYNGTYYENLVINNSIYLVGEDKNTTIIDGIYGDCAVFINSDEVGICHFTITNMTGGIYLNYSEFNSIYQNRIFKNWIGLTLFFSNNNQIYNNFISNNNYYGLEPKNNNNTILKNIIYNNEKTIELISANNNIIK